MPFPALRLRIRMQICALSTPNICELWIKHATLIAEIQDRLFIQFQSKLGPTLCAPE
jgi:hypothetical protein